LRPWCASPSSAVCWGERPLQEWQLAAGGVVRGAARSGRSHLHDRVVVTVDEVADGLDHPKLDVVVNLGHEAKVQDGQAAVGRADEVAGVRVRVERACVKHPRRSNLVVQLRLQCVEEPPLRVLVLPLSQVGLGGPGAPLPALGHRALRRVLQTSRACSPRRAVPLSRRARHSSAHAMQGSCRGRCAASGARRPECRGARAAAPVSSSCLR
jgi:hypothetical protein